MFDELKKFLMEIVLKLKYPDSIYIDRLKMKVDFMVTDKHGRIRNGTTTKKEELVSAFINSLTLQRDVLLRKKSNL
jgi:hypothetical protein